MSQYKSAIPGGNMRPWAELIDAVTDNDALKGVREKFIAMARKAAAEPVIRRVYKLEDIGKHRSWLDGRSRALEDEIRETFALAMSDHMACSRLSTELPLLAAACRLTRDISIERRVVEQLEEMATWSPIQRPGWTCFQRGNRLPSDGKDGNWLATGSGIRAIADTLEIMPGESIDHKLRIRLEQLLEKEIFSIVDDWATKRSWFIKSENFRTNQWVLPTEGLIRACLVLGVDKYREAYELGMKNMLKSLDAYGYAGEFDEGLLYSVMTMISVAHVARAAAVAGDRRLLDHPFLQRFPTWMMHHLQPARKLINAFDCFMCEAPRGSCGHTKGWSFRQLLSLLAVCFPSSVARWGLVRQFDGPSDDIAGLACSALPPGNMAKSPALYAAYERAARVNWRDSWADDATGVWIRGGHCLDQHDHKDRGHVNFTSRGHPVLVEAGTPSYHNSRMHSYFSAGTGHNVLQLGMSDWNEKQNTYWNQPPGWQKAGAPAPIIVHRLDQEGGDIRVDVTEGYDGLEKWSREVSWTSTHLSVQDEVILTESRGRDIILFRWHLGTEEEVEIKCESQQMFTVTWSDVTLKLEGSQALIVLQEKVPDQSLVPRDWDDASPDHLHTCIVVRTKYPVDNVKLTTRLASEMISRNNEVDND